MNEVLPLLLIAVVFLVIGYVAGRHGSSAEPAVRLDQALEPVNASMQSLAEQVRRVEREQSVAQAELRTALSTQLTEQVQAMVRSSDDVRREAAHLRAVLGRTGARGRWGEMQLRRLVEASGLIDRVHFDEQASHRTDDGTLRPDMVVRLTGDRGLVVDAKVPLAAYLSAELADDDHAQTAVVQHAADVVRHIDALGAKAYQEAVPDTVDFVVMFLPSESLLEAALAVRPDLLDYAFARNVVPATPTTLFALLRTVALTWREERLAEHAHEIERLGRELHGRLATLAGHFSRLGASLDSAVGHYNKAIGSLESRVLVTARSFQGLGVTDDPMPEVPVVSQPTRGLAAAELVAGLDHDEVTFLADRAR